MFFNLIKMANLLNWNTVLISLYQTHAQICFNHYFVTSHTIHCISSHRKMEHHTHTREIKWLKVFPGNALPLNTHSRIQLQKSELVFVLDCDDKPSTLLNLPSTSLCLLRLKLSRSPFWDWCSSASLSVSYDRTNKYTLSKFADDTECCSLISQN